MNIPNPTTDVDAALAGIPKIFRNRLVSAYFEVKQAFVEGRSDISILKSGRFCEVALRFLQSHLTGTYIPFSKKIPNFKVECESLEVVPKNSAPEGLRLLMPRVLVFLYSIRNKRDAGHVGGEVDANSIDATVCARIVDWCLCEFLRIFHNLPLEDAQSLLNSIAARELPQVWSILGRKRILDTSLNYKEKTLLLLYDDQHFAVPTEDLFDWIEHSRISRYKNDILIQLHQDKFIEYDRELEMVILSPKGIQEVESNLLPKKL